jgi:hypothetical protein
MPGQDGGAASRLHGSFALLRMTDLFGIADRFGRLAVQDERLLGDSMMARILDCVLAWALVMAMAAAGVGQTGAAPANMLLQDHSSADQASGEKAGGLQIGPEEVPVTHPRESYAVRLYGRGDYVPTLSWRLESGTLPPGITLSDDGELRGAAERAGEFQFVVEARDSGKPQQGARRTYVIKVVEGVRVEWKVPAHVTANRIDGSVAVTNTTADDLDLTFDVKAVAENGRATEIGYQHFLLKKGTVGMALPFGETLPHGAYVVYVNVAGEVAKRNLIYRQRMQTAGALQVAVGP